MSTRNFVLVDSCVLPEVYTRVLEAKRVLEAGEAETASEAARMCGISRGTFYKYKDCVFEYHEQAGANPLTVRCMLRDNAGALSALISKISGSGANIVTINQSPPSKGTAAVAVSFKTPESFDMNAFFDSLRELRDVSRVELSGSEQ